MPPSSSISKAVPRPKCLFQSSKKLPSIESRRYESSYRRHVKRANLPPAPFTTPKPSQPKGSHIIFNPPPSSPNVYHTPLKFLPPGDRRRQLYAQAQSLYTVASSTRKASSPWPVTKPGTALHESTSTVPASLLPRIPEGAPLPPALKPPAAKKYHLGQEEIEEIRRLRMEDPNTWTRDKLAEKFGCSSFFVSVIYTNHEAGKAHEKRREETKDRWGLRKTDARKQRERRKALWGRDA